MMDTGLKEVPNPSQMLLEGRPEGASGTCVSCVMEGTRPVLAEVLAQLCQSAGGHKYFSGLTVFPLEDLVLDLILLLGAAGEIVKYFIIHRTCSFRNRSDKYII